MNKQLSLSLKHIPEDQLLSLEYFQNRGDHFINRAFIDDKQGERDRIYSDVIKDFHEGCGSNLTNIVGNDPVALKAAFTTFQWLSTNVGSAVLQEALMKTGQKVVARDET
jgi:hypothetical protein